MSEKENKYKQLLNNLLDIKTRGDQAVFTNIENALMFDVYNKFGKSVEGKILNQNECTFPADDLDYILLLAELPKAETKEEVLELFERYNVPLTQRNRELIKKSSDLERTKESLDREFSEKEQKSNIKWQQYRRKVIDEYTQSNVWPLYVGTGYISLASPVRNLYAPCFLKEVQINYDNNKNQVVLKTNGDWVINEKLLFMLNESGYVIDAEIFKDDDSLEKLKTTFEEVCRVKFPIEPIAPFENIKSYDIKNTIIQTHPGVVLGWFRPGGGKLRQRMLDIIANDELDSILDVEFDKNIYKDNIDDFVKDTNSVIYHIQPSNFSQEIALISALKQNTIIWGPPGTGKSQVIANVIANILEKGKTALVASQKKAALDVLKKRLGKISKFVFFAQNSDMSKREFYEPLQDFISTFENYRRDITEKIYSKPLMSKEEFQMLWTLNREKEDGVYDNSLKLLEQFNDNISVLENLFKLNPNWKYPNNSFDKKQMAKDIMNLNNIQPDKTLGFIKTTPKSIKYAVDILINIYNMNPDDNLDVNLVMELTSKTTLKDVLDLKNVAKTKIRPSEFKSDEDYLTSVFCARLYNKLSQWHYSYDDRYYKYSSFANAIRAGRALPYKFMNKFQDIIQEFFPVMVITPQDIMPWWETESLDYAILDESSQMFLEVGLPLISYAKIKVLAGDTEQMQPSSWFATRDNNESEDDIAENANSLLDYAKEKGVFSVMLNQNYRSSSASLMSFSSKNFYNSGLDVLDKKGIDSKEAIEVINVDGVWNEGINIPEAKKAIQVTKDLLCQYDSIILLTFNSKQREIIEKRILTAEPELAKAMEPDEEGNPQLSIRNIENIQGDEADVVVMSVVYTPETRMASTYVTKPGGKNALNVAISRAKDKMIVIKSVTSENVQIANTEDFQVFREWLRFLDMTCDEQKRYSISNQNFSEGAGEVDSSFERSVIEFIKENVKTDRKIDILKQYEVGSYFIDIALVDERTREFILGIEVDGYRYHGGMGYNKYLQDYARQMFIESKGFPIYRIREIDFKINKEGIKKDLEELINN
ncbi:AAA domain-containing protein [Mesoplasma lactucae]|uniref:Uncharacterized protein n=1 Tax=Mesoplasma lactucae ATCC 49193 TaxID=81460 RepID=A0A291ISE9_9MOLU|nr:AAA domain-containing protein [Mesoplasma lactucae]ATG97680.1 hypothetical protein CP520_02990 [Mesoplasma lactucae ATCC 49193]ATZ19855.1 hypothetical protein MLACT_v1c00300 [Mesoplasma lactucae ATCC 49193]MCL8216718.1 hypothetical protein [Mesoplasma lactucae ATCC 49193]